MKISEFEFICKTLSAFQATESEAKKIKKVMSKRRKGKRYNPNK